MAKKKPTTYTVSTVPQPAETLRVREVDRKRLDELYNHVKTMLNRSGYRDGSLWKEYRQVVAEESKLRDELSKTIDRDPRLKDLQKRIRSLEAASDKKVKELWDRVDDLRTLLLAGRDLSAVEDELVNISKTLSRV